MTEKVGKIYFHFMFNFKSASLKEVGREGK